MSDTPADSKLAISLRKLTAALTSGIGQRGAGAFAEAQAEVEQGFGAHGEQLRAMAGFGRAVAEDAVVEQGRGEARGDERGRADDETVDEQHHLRFGRGQHGADHGGDLEAAEFGQHLERIVAAICRAVANQGLFEQILLAGETGVVQAGATPDAFGQRQAGQAVGEQRSGGRIANAHFTEADDIATRWPPARARCWRPFRWPGCTGRRSLPAARCSWRCPERS